jgi:peptide/nickel transport system substrate-binding protein
VTDGPRRLRAAVVAVVVGMVVALGVGVGACAHHGPGSQNGKGAATSSTATAGGGGGAAVGGGAAGTVRLGVPEEPASLDPFDPKSRTLAGEAILGEVLPQLFRVDPGGREMGWLADAPSVRVAPDGRSAAFTLRSGARWSDGAPITVDDLRFTLDTVRGDAWPGPRAGYDRLTAVDGVGASVTFRFDGPFPGWRRLFSGADFVLPAHRLSGKDLHAEWKQGPDLFGGPFGLGPVTPGLSVVLPRNDSWWGGKAKAAAIEVLVVPDVRTMEQLLRRRELDVAWPPATSNRIGRFRALPGVDVSVAEPGGTVETLVANTTTLPVDRRLAYLGLANRDRFVDVVLAGEADRAVSLAGPASGAAAGAATWATAAVQPVAGALKGVMQTTLVADEEDELSPLVGRVLQQGAAANGATVELKSDESTKVDATWLPEGRFDLALMRTVAWPEPCWSCWFAEPATGRGNVTRVKGLTPLAAAADTDPAAVPALETRVRAEGLLLPLWRPRAVLAGAGVAGLVANSWSVGPFWSAESWAPAR